MKSTIQKGLMCLKCKDKIFSNYRHDFRRCKCGQCFVDGGFNYLRYGYPVNGRDSVEIIKREVFTVAELSVQQINKKRKRVSKLVS